MPYAVAAAAIAAGGAAYSADQAKSGAAEQVKATDRAIAEQNRNIALTRSDNAQFLRTGTSANQRLAQLLGINNGVDESDPRYQAIYNKLHDDYSALHYARYGTPLDASTDQASLAMVQKQLQSQAAAEYKSQYGNESVANDPAFGSLLRKFTQADLEADPVYQSGIKFGAQQGQDAINARATQAGNYDSGATLKALTRFNSDYASTKANDAYNRFTNDQNNIFNRLSGISGTGQVATSQVGASGANTTNAIAQSLTEAGNARAAGIVGGANAWGNAGQSTNSAINNYQNNQLLQKILAGQNNNGGQTSNFAYTGYDRQGDYAYG